MRVFRTDKELPNDAKGAAIALGNFDGVHRGHQAVIASAADAAEASAAPLGVAVFEPHPLRVLQPDARPWRLQNAAQRARALEALGVALLYEIGFDAALSKLSDEDFAERVLKGRFGVGHVSVGADFRYGRGRMGDAASLARWGDALGFTTQALAPVTHNNAKYSSTAIRAAIGAGDMQAAAEMLTRPWAIAGVVQRGFARGRGFGYATANVALGDYVRPRLGVYAVRVDLGDGAWRAGVASVGVNPTVGALPEPLLEAHLFDFDAELYGRAIEVELAAFLRDEEKFASTQAMRKQIDDDARQARAILA